MAFHVPPLAVALGGLILPILLATAHPSSAQTTNLTAIVEGEIGSGYGYSVAIDGNTIAVGDRGHGWTPDHAGTGGVHLFNREASAWMYKRVLVPEGAHTLSDIGRSVDLHQHVLAVGAPGYGSSNATSGSGAVFVLEEKDNWATTVRLQASDPDPGSAFGAVVAVGTDAGANFIVVGSPERNNNQGGVHLFVQQSGEWSEVQTLWPEGTQRFGSSIAIHENRVVIGAGDAYSGSDGPAGHLFVYTFAENAFHLDAELIPPDGLPWDGLGHSVAIYGDRIVAGAPDADVIPDPTYPFRGSKAGVVHVFERADDSWTHTGMLTDRDPATSDHFGWSVALHADQLVVGVPGADDAGGDSGNLQLYGLTSGQFKEQGRLAPESSAERRDFGHSAAMDGTGFVAGSASPPFTVMTGDFMVGLATHPTRFDHRTNTLAVHPNPASSTFNLTTGPGNGQLQVFDLLGRRVHDASIAGSHHTWTPTGLPAGTYVMVVRQGRSLASSLVIYRP